MDNIEVLNSENLPTSSATTLSEEDKIRAATNSPTLAADQFQLGDRVFPILDLSYDDYITFISHLQPLFEFLADQIKTKMKIGIPGLELKPEMFSPNNLIKFCAKTLPDMVCIMCKQSDPSMTAEEVKRLSKKPTVLASCVIKQVVQNKMIADFADFFAQIAVMMGDNKKSQLIQEQTPSA